jgi:tape measure domain-containing protein
VNGTEAARLFATVDADTSGFTRGMGKVQDSLNRTAGASQSAFSKMKDFAGGQIIGTYALEGMNAALSFGREALIGYNARLEQVTMGFTSMFKSGDMATEFIGQLQEFARKTPFEFSQLVETAQRMMAMGFAAKDVIPVLTDVGDAMSAMGKTGQDVDRVTYALSQMMASGRVNANDMLQLTSAGIPAWKYLSKAIGKSVAETRKLSEQGLIPAEVGLKAIREGMKTDFGGMMQAQSRTFIGAMSNIKDASFQLVASAMKPLFTEISTVAVAIADLMGSDEARAWFKGLTDQIQGTVDRMKAAVKGAGKFSWALDYLKDAVGEVVGIGQAMFKTTENLTRSFMRGLGPLDKFGKSLGSRLIGALKGVRKAIESVSRTLSRTLGPIFEAVGKVIKNFVRGGDDLNKNLDETAFWAEKVTYAVLGFLAVKKVYATYKATTALINSMTASYGRMRAAAIKATSAVADFGAKISMPTNLNFSGGAKAGTNFVDDILRGFTSAAPALAIGMQGQLGGIAARLGPLLANPYVAVGAAIVAAIGSVLIAPEFMGELLGNIVAGFINLAVALPGAFVDVLAGIGGAFAKAFTDTISGAMKGIEKILKGDILGGLGDLVWSIVSFIPRIFGGVLSAIWEGMVSLWNNVFDFSGVLKWVGERLSMFVNSFWTTLSTKLSDGAKSAIKGLMDLGKGLVDAIGKGIQAAIATVINTLIIKPVNAMIWAYNLLPFGDIPFMKEIAMPKFKTGGIVPGGTSQAVPIMAHGGEAVLPASLVRALTDGSAGSGGGGNTVAITMNLGKDSVRSDGDIDKIANALMRKLRMAGGGAYSPVGL